MSRGRSACRTSRRWPRPAARTGCQHLTARSRPPTVAFDREGIRINLGSIGKGYAIDRAVDLIRGHWWPTSALVHGGQSSLFALGSPPGQLGGRWEIAVRNPFDATEPLGTLRLRNRGLGTSGAAFQQFVVDGRIYGHIIDPRSGEPASGPASVTVLAPTAALADALSTAFYLLGPDGDGCLRGPTSRGRRGHRRRGAVHGITSPARIRLDRVWISSPRETR